MLPLFTLLLPDRETYDVPSSDQDAKTVLPSSSDMVTDISLPVSVTKTLQFAVVPLKLSEGLTFVMRAVSAKDAAGIRESSKTTNNNEITFFKKIAPLLF